MSTIQKDPGASPLIRPLELHYKTTKRFFNAPTTSENSFVAALQKTATVGMSVIVALAETIRNVLAGFADVVFIAPVNFAGKLFQSTEASKTKKSEEQKLAEKPVAQSVPQAQPKPVENDVRLTIRIVQHPSDWERFKGGVSSLVSGAWSSIKAHPYRTASVVVGAATLGAGYHFGAHSYLAAKVAEIPSYLAAKFGSGFPGSYGFYGSSGFY